MSSPVFTRIPTPEGATARKEVEPTRAPRPGGDLPGPVGTPAPGSCPSAPRSREMIPMGQRLEDSAHLGEQGYAAV